jgi:uncharacterized protein (TIGR02996 family)
MNPEEGFLQAIREEPRNDTHRLIYADWLEERGDPRGELIHVQCRLAELPEKDERRHELLDRQSRLLADHGDDWLADLPHLPGILWEWDRGFPWAVSAVSLEAFREHAAAIFRTLPLQKLSVRVTGHADLQLLVEIPGVERLAALDLSYGGIGDRGARLLAQAKVFRDLQALGLRTNSLHNVGLQTLAESPYLAELTSLDVSSNGIVGAVPLGRWKHLTRLARLNLDTNDLGPQGVEGLMTSPHVARLRMLNLSYNQVGNEGVEVLARTSPLHGLTALYLRGDEIGDRGAADLATAPHFARLQTLDLSRNRITDRGARALGRSATLANLSSLYLSRNPISPAMQQRLADHFGPRVVF